MKTIYLIDGSSFAYRAFYAIGQLSTRMGQPTNAVYGFTRILNRLIEKYNPEYLAIVFDTGKPTFRHERYEHYKAHRKPMPDELVSQMEWIKKVVTAYNIKVIEKEGYEGDDVIATLAVNAEREGFLVYIVTGDKDMMQLVNERILILNPSKDEDIVYDSKKVTEKFGVEPAGITELLALTGDSSDNIPGVQGIGEKTASRLIKQYGGLHGILENLDKVTPKIKDALELYKDRITENIELVTVKKNVLLDIQPGDCILKGPNTDILKDIYRELEFKVLLKELLEKDKPAVNPPADGETIVDSYEKWTDVFRGLKNVSALGITENSLAYEKDNDLRGVRLMPEPDTRIWEDISKILQAPDIKKYGYDIKSLLREKGEDIKGSFFDVYLGGALLGADIPETYKDSAIDIYKAVPSLERDLINEGLFDLYHKIELPLLEVLLDMERKGIKLNIDILKKLSAELETDLGRLTEKIHKLAGEPFNINSPKQLEYILFEKLRLPAGRRTKTGYSTDADVLEKLSKFHELPGYILDYRQFNKLKGTYVDPLPELVNPVTGRLHTTFNQIGAATGRISSSNPNLQNIPIKTDLGRKIRQAFIPEPGFLFLGADYSQIELRLLAHLSGDISLIKAFQEDKDIHAQTARELFGVSASENTAPELRRQAKIVNFGIIYGMGSKAMAEGLGLSIEEAQGFIDRYFERYPDVARYVEDELIQAKEHGYVVTMFGRKRRVPELSSSKPQIEALGRRIAVNTPIQGSAADIIKLAMINIYRKNREKGLNASMLLQIHDELIFEVPEESADEAVEFVREEMENVVRLKVPQKVDIKIGRSWADL